jgi:hypothetical protein
MIIKRFTMIDVSIVPSNVGAHFPVKLGTGLLIANLYFASFAWSGKDFALKLPYFPKNIKSSLKYQYPNISSGRVLS